VKNINLSDFLRSFKVAENGNYCILMGAGTSIQAGIPTGNNLIWEFKKEIYCSETNTHPERFKDLVSESNRSILQSYFDSQGNNPNLYDPREYSHYFEKCYPISRDREQYISKLVRNINPSLGHKCLGQLIISGKVKNVFTTNFDSLIESGIATLNPSYAYRVFSSANNSSLNNISDRFASITKLHGDYRYDKIKNTVTELQELKINLNEYFKNTLKQSGLIVIGYAGNDDSIMNLLEDVVGNSKYLPYGLIWLKYSKANIEKRVESLMEKASIFNEGAGIINIDGFDEFMYECYKYCDGNNDIINEQWKNFDTRKLPIQFSSKKVDHFIKLNTFESTEYPQPLSFDTDITTWQELRDIVGTNEIIAGLYARKIYCFGSLNLISKVFGKHILSNPQVDEIEKRHKYREFSFYNGMLYDLIKYTLVMKYNLHSCGKNKYYDPINKTLLRDYNISYIRYEAIKVNLEYINEKYYLSLIITYHLTYSDDTTLSKDCNKKLINKNMSTLYNDGYNELIRKRNSLLSKNSIIEFNIDNHSLKFNNACISYGTTTSPQKLPQKNAFKFDEPLVAFDVNDNSKSIINQLNGLLKYSLIDISYTKGNNYRPSINIYISYLRHPKYKK